MIKSIFLGIGTVLTLDFFSLVILKIRNRQEVSQIEKMLKSEPMHQRFTEDMIAELPAPVQRYFLRCT